MAIPLRWAILLIALPAIIDAIGSKQNVTVRGQLKCKNRNVPDTVVQLWDKETLKKDDLLESFTTNPQGHFFIVGYDTQIAKIKPYVRIEHKCGAKPGCHKVTEITLDPMWVGKQKDLAFVYLDQETREETDVKMAVRDECPPKARA